MKAILASAVCLALSGCAIDQQQWNQAWSNFAKTQQENSVRMQAVQMAPYVQQCRGFGFTDDTPQMAQCVQAQYNAANRQPVPLNCARYDTGLVCQ